MAATNVSPTTRRRIEALKAEADHTRRRYDLYKQKAYSSRPTSADRLRELKRDSEIAQMRLIRARADV
jgi:hypothetical protein